MKKLIFILIPLIFSSCSKSIMPIPVTFVPEINLQPDKSASYGVYPEQYQKILKDYLRNKIQDTSIVKLEFVNKPNKIALTHLDTDYYGYRVCLSLDDKNVNRTGVYKNHFFLINDSQVLVHLFDKLCYLPVTFPYKSKH